MNMKKWMMIVMMLCAVACVEAARKPEAKAELPITVVPLKRLEPEWRAERHAEKVVQAKQGKAEFVMIGDSITHYWNKQRNYKETFSKYNTLNLGFGGDRTQNVIWRIQNGEIDGISPKLVTIMIGTNNISRDKPADIALGIKTIVAELRKRLPDSKIVIFSIFPRNHPRVNGDFEQVKEVNKLIPSIADNKHVFHVDINKNFLDDNGKLKAELYGRDLLHLSNKGYEVWANALQPLLTEAGLKHSRTLKVDAKSVGRETFPPVTPTTQAGRFPALQGGDVSPDEAGMKAKSQPIIRLWPIEMVGGEQNRLKDVFRDRRGTPQLCGVLDPNMTVYKADSNEPTPAIIYCPGGAYKILAIPSAAEIKQWNDLGITLFILKYTIPSNPDAAFKDIQRAMRMVRHQAKKWNVDPNMIGVLGNSAGGHLSARLTQNYTEKVYDALDDADKESCEPNFAVLQCAAYFQGIKMDKDFDAQLFPMKNKVAPTFLTYAKDDKFSIGGVEYEKRLTEAGGTIHLKLFEKGGHGMRDCDWFSEAAKWLRSNEIVK